MSNQEIKELLKSYSTSGRVYITLDEYIRLEPLIRTIDICRKEMMAYKFDEKDKKLQDLFDCRNLCNNIINDGSLWKQHDIAKKRLKDTQEKITSIVTEKNDWKNSLILQLRNAEKEYRQRIEHTKTLNENIDVEKNITITYEQYRLMLEPHQMIEELISSIMMWYKDKCPFLTEEVF